MKNLNVTPKEIYFLVQGKNNSIYINDYCMNGDNLNLNFTKVESDALQFLQYKDANAVKKELKEKYNINLVIKKKQIDIKEIHSLDDVIDY